MHTDERRALLLQVLTVAKDPVTGQSLADQFSVSRQVIVQDIAVLRAAGHAITATPQGYLKAVTSAKQRPRKQIAVRHANNPEDIERELNTIVDLGGKVLDTIVEHPLYGELRGLLMISSRHDVRVFLQRLAQAQAEPLLILTDGVHLHTVEADDPLAFDRIETALFDLGMRPF